LSGGQGADLGLNPKNVLNLEISLPEEEIYVGLTGAGDEHGLHSVSLPAALSHAGHASCGRYAACRRYTCV